MRSRRGALSPPPPPLSAPLPPLVPPPTPPPLPRLPPKTHPGPYASCRHEQPPCKHSPRPEQPPAHGCTCEETSFTLTVLPRLGEQLPKQVSRSSGSHRPGSFQLCFQLTCSQARVVNETPLARRSKVPAHLLQMKPFDAAPPPPATERLRPAARRDHPAVQPCSTAYSVITEIRALMRYRAIYA